LCAGVVVALLAGCSNGTSTAGDDSVPGTTDASTATEPTTDPTTTIAGDRGWLGGEPDWTSHSDEEGVLEMSASDGSGLDAAAPADSTAPGEVESQRSALRAGSVDDNADFAAFLQYLARIDELGIATRDFDPTGRIVVEVTNADGASVAGIAVTVSAAGRQIATIRTTADGTARFLPALYGASGTVSFDFAAGGATATGQPNSTVSLTAASEAVGGLVALDVMFLLDATGSMGDEIDRLKTTIDSVAARVAAFEVQPDVRFAMTLYRDEGDVFVTSTFDFTSDVEAFRAALQNVVADGGGDYPEAVEEGLAEALTAPAWRDPAETLQLVFLIGDAPPRLDRQVPTPYPAAVIDAIERGIKVFPIASSESDDQAEAVFRELAVATGARFVFLSYGAAGTATGESSDIESTDYEELALDDLVVRLIAEEVADLTGADPGVPDVTVPPPTNPEGQGQ
jgi:hypothetical protein